MNIKEAYNTWAGRYDTNSNKTRDLEAISLRETLANVPFESCLEMGCGTGKNTAWLLTKAKQLLSVDLSEEMLAKACQKITAEHVVFKQVDMLQPWTFTDHTFDLVVFSLVLEHIEDLSAVFKKVANVTKPGGFVYIGELHPFKQYSGTKARFETEAGLQVLTCFDHHVSDFTQAALQNGFAIETLNEYFDENDKHTLPRILTLLLRKK
jgi:ubiquinone/menaquinone biosynthesis C-methylase UbiE